MGILEKGNGGNAINKKKESFIRCADNIKRKVCHMSRFGVSERKVAIIGAGFVGASIAYALTIRKLAREIVLIDIDEKKTEGEALDIQHGIPDMGISTVHAGQYADCKDCDLIIITAGRNRKPGETRLDLITGNSQIIKDVVGQLKRYYTKGVIMIVSNPVDVLVYQLSLIHI